MEETRRCPGCEAPMEVMLAGRVELDRCESCGGIWFDGGELEQVLGRAVEVERTGASMRPCAYCGSLMLLGRAKGVEVETCASCRGIHLDDGELERIAGLAEHVETRSMAAAAPPVGLAVGATEMADEVKPRSSFDGDSSPVVNAIDSVHGVIATVDDALRLLDLLASFL